MTKSIYIYILIVFISTFSVFGLYTRVIGIETKKWSISNTFFQVLNFIPQTIGLILTPIITLYTESALNKNIIIPYTFYQSLIFFNLIGTIIGFYLLPLYIGNIKKIINLIYEGRKVKFNLLKFNYTIKNSYDEFSKNKYFKKLEVNYFFISNLIVGFLLSIAFPLCVYIGYQISLYRATFISSVSLIIGITTILNVLFIDFKISIICDKIINDNTEIKILRSLIINCIVGRIFGIIISVISFPIISKATLFLINKLILYI